MNPISNPWEMFHSTHMGDNINELVETEECKIMRLNDETGEGIMTIYHIFDGVYLMYNDFHLQHCYSHFTSNANLLCIDHCREGRIEHKTNHQMLYYMEAGDLRIDRRVHHTGNIEFPLSHYHGITIGFFVDDAEKAMQESMQGVSVDLRALSEKFGSSERPYILHKNSMTERILSGLYHVPAKIRMDYFKIKIIELLVCLNALELSDYKDEHPYFYSGQIEKIKAVHKLITNDLRTDYTAEKLASDFDISVSALKSGFKGVYGCPLYTYLRHHKMNVAASLLLTDRTLRVIDVAEQVGYNNPSKFAAAFKAVFGVSPTKYRIDRR